LKAVFSVVRTVAVIMQQHGKHVSAATFEPQQKKNGVFYVVRAEGLSMGQV
jgi:hypothetical protein